MVSYVDEELLLRIIEHLEQINRNLRRVGIVKPRPALTLSKRLSLTKKQIHNSAGAAKK